MNEEELRNLMFTAAKPRKEGAFTIRYPRGQGVMPDWRKPMQEIEIGKGRVIQEGEELAILTIGHIGNYAVEVTETLAKEGYNIGHFDMRFAKPLDEEMLHHIFGKYNKIITVEDGCVMGGFGSAILEFASQYHYVAEVKLLGIPDGIIEHGEQVELHKECGFDPQGIYLTAKTMIETTVKV
jgi:1-deoxy-D-xylulose-5-phosphate synthase